MSEARAPTQHPSLMWTEDGQTHVAQWRSETGAQPPKKVVVADDTLPADVAYRLACEGTGLLWRGDFQNARQLLQALGRRVDKRQAQAAARTPSAAQPADLTQAFHRHRKAQAERARILARLLIPVEADDTIALRRAPDVRAACTEAYGRAEGAVSGPYVVPLRELQGLIGAHEWRKKGVPVAALGGATIHPHYGVFSPVRGEYLDLVAQAPLPAALSQAGDQVAAWDIGTGTGVLAAVLLRKGVPRVVATELALRALACADDNLQRLGLRARVDLQACDLFPAGQAGLIVCNPPWLPGKPSSAVEQAVYDPDHRMLRGFLAGVGAHLAPGGEAWLILSDLAEHLGLRSREQLMQWMAEGGLQVLGRLDTRPRHGKAQDRDDPLHAARSRELTSLWRLGRAQPITPA